MDNQGGKMTSGKKLSQKVESFSRYERFLLLSKLNFPSINGKVFSVKKAIEF